MTKRYTLVRVDGVCPTRFECRNFEGIINYYVCDDRKDNKKQPNCNKCLYGDTKEQLVNKITIAIEIAITKYEKGEVLSSNKNKALAEIIVDFLGVEE